jgi:hypothetical protein
LRGFVYGFGKGNGKAFREAFDQAFGKGLAKQEQEQEQEQEGGIPPAKALAGDESADEDPLAEARKAAREAFDRWSHRDRRHGLNLEANEHAVVSRLVEQCAECTPIVRGSEQVRRHLLIPQVVEHLIAKSRPFKSPDYACGTARKELDEWARLGVPGVSRPGPGQPRQGITPRVLTGAVIHE